MNKERITKIEVKLPLITDDELRVLDNNFGYIVDEVIKAQCKEKELALLQLIIKKQQQALIDIKEYINGAYEMSTYTKSVSLDEENIEDILQIIDKVFRR